MNRIVKAGLMGWLLATTLQGCQPEASGSGALGVALLHARDVITSGEIQVSPDTVAETLDERSLARAADEAGLAFGADESAVRCRGFLGCESVGSFRGLVHVVAHHRPEADSVVVTLRMLRFGSELGPLYEQVDEVHVTRSAPRAPWRIAKVVGISES